MKSGIVVLLVVVILASACLTCDAIAAQLLRGQRSPAFLQQSFQVQQEIASLQTVAISAEAKATTEEQAILNNPGVQSALNSKTPDAVDRLIQDILVGKGSGGVVTTEFNKPGVHVTIISNVNQLRVTAMDNSKEENHKAVSEQKRKQEIIRQDENTERHRRHHHHHGSESAASEESSQAEHSEASEASETSEASRSASATS